MSPEGESESDGTVLVTRCRGLAWASGTLGTVFIQPGQPPALGWGKPRKPLAVTDLIVRWIVAAGNLDIWRVLADRVPVGVNLARGGDSGIATHRAGR